MTLNFFSRYVLPPVIITLGLVGNTFGLLLMSRKELKSIGPVLIYICLFVLDTIYLGNNYLLFFEFLKKFNFYFKYEFNLNFLYKFNFYIKIYL